MIVPEKLINFKVYKDATDLIGIADAQLPSIDFVSDTIKGAGIAGEIETPTLGAVGKMTMSITWRNITGDVTQLAAQKGHQLTLRGAQQHHDAGLGQLITVPIKVMVVGLPKKIDLGKMQVGASTDTKTEFEITYLKVWVNDIEQIEIDKYNFIYKVQGSDYLADVKAALGM